MWAWTSEWPSGASDGSLRVGLVTARTLGAVLSIPVVGVCTLDVLALAAVDALGGRTIDRYDHITFAQSPSCE